MKVVVHSEDTRPCEVEAGNDDETSGEQGLTDGVTLSLAFGERI